MQRMTFLKAANADWSSVRPDTRLPATYETCRLASLTDSNSVLSLKIFRQHYTDLHEGTIRT